MGVLVNIFPVSLAMLLHGIIQLTSNGYRAWLNREHVLWPIVLSLFLGNLAVFFMLYFMSFVPDRITVLFVLGLMPYIAWLLPEDFSPDVTRKPVGFLAGMVVVGSNLLAGVGGPLLDILFQKVNMTRYQVVATKAVAQSLGHISKILFFGSLLYLGPGNPDLSAWVVFLAMTASVLGTTMGKKILDKLEDATFFAWTQRIVLGVGAVFILQAIYLLL